MAEKIEDWQRDETGLRQARNLLQPCIPISGNASAESEWGPWERSPPESMKAGVTVSIPRVENGKHRRGWIQRARVRETERKHRGDGGWTGGEGVRRE